MWKINLHNDFFSCLHVQNSAFGKYFKQKVHFHCQLSFYGCFCSFVKLFPMINGLLWFMQKSFVYFRVNKQLLVLILDHWISACEMKGIKVFKCAEFKLRWNISLNFLNPIWMTYLNHTEYHIHNLKINFCISGNSNK